MISAKVHEQIMARERMRETLKSGRWTVEFTKVDGTAAVMECTLNPFLMPAAAFPKPAAITDQKEDSLDTLRVYSLDRKGWRSFKISNVRQMYQSPSPL